MANRWVGKNCKLFPPNWPPLSLLVTFLYHFIKQLLWWSPVLPLTVNTVNHVASLVIELVIVFQSQCIHKIWKNCSYEYYYHCTVVSVCMCAHCCLSVHKGVCLPGWVCLVATTWCKLHACCVISHLMFLLHTSRWCLLVNNQICLWDAILPSFVSCLVLYA